METPVSDALAIPDSSAGAYDLPAANTPEDRTGTYLDELPKDQWPAEAQLQHGLVQHARKGTPWEKVSEEVGQKFPGIDQEAVKGHYGTLGHAVKMEAARQDLEGAQETRSSWLSRHVLPFGSSLVKLRQTQEYASARKRFEEGAPNPDDYKTIAGYEKIQQLDAGQGLGGRTLSAVAHVPAIIGEFMAGGAILKGAAGLLPRAAIPYVSQGAAEAAKVAIPKILTMAGLASAGSRLALQTAAVPSMYAEKWAQDNVKNGRDPLDPRGFAPAFALGMMQVGVLGAIGGAGAAIEGRAIGPWLSRAAQGVGTGLVGQQAVDVGASLASEVLPEAYKLETGYGAFGDAVHGKWGEAGEKLFLQAVTFTAFSALHAHQYDPSNERYQETLQRLMTEEMTPLQKVLGQMRRQALSGEGAAKQVYPAYEVLGRVLQVHDVVPPERADIEKAMGELPEGPIRDFGMQLAERFSQTAKKAQEKPPEPPEGKAPPEPPPMPPGQPQEAPGAAQATSADPQARADALEAQHRELLPKLLTAQANEQAVHDLLSKGMDKTAEWKQARQKRRDLQKQIKDVRNQLSAARDEIMKQTAADQSGPGKPTSDLDAMNEALGRGPAVQEVPPVPPSPHSEGAVETGENTTSARQPFLSQEQFDIENARKGGYTDAEIARAKRFGLRLPSGDKDQVTDYQSREARGQTLERAIEHVGKTGEPGVYVSMDLSNLGGLNAKLGSSGADKVFRSFADIVQEELRGTGADVNMFRHGGDEMSAVVVNGSKQAVLEAMRRAHGKILAHAKAEGLDTIEHPKYKGDERRRGTGIYFDVGEIEKDSKPKELIKKVDDGIEARKKEVFEGKGKLPEAPKPPFPHSEGTAPPRLTPAEAKAEADRLLAEAEPRGQPLTEEQARSIEGANLDAKQARAIRALMEQGSFRKAGKTTGMSHEWVRTHAKVALEKLKAADPEAWQDTEITREGFQRARDERAAGAVEKPTGLPGESQKTVQAAMQAAKRLHELQDSEIDARMADRAFQDSMDEEALNHLLNHPDLAVDVEEIKNAINADAKRSGLKPEALRREIIAELRKSLADTQTRAAVESAQGPAPAHGEAESAPGGRGQEAGDELTAAQLKKIPQQYLDQAREMGIGPRYLEEAAEEVRKQDAQQVAEHNEVIRETKKMLGRYGKVLHLERGLEDPSQIPGFDEAVDWWKGRIPHYGDEAVLYDALKAGQRKPLSTDAVYEQALENLKAPPPSWQPDIFGGKSSVAQQRSMFPEEARPKAPEPAEPDQAQLFGDAYEREMTPGERNSVMDGLADFFGEESGAVDLQRLGQIGRQVWDRIKSAAHHFNMNMKQLAGAIAPRTSEIDPESGNALARLVAVDAYVKRGVPTYIDKVMGPKATPEQLHLFGETFHEERVQTARQNLTDAAAAALKAGDQAKAQQYLDAHNAIKSMVGAPGKRLQSQADYQKTLADPDYKASLGAGGRYEKEVAPVFEEMFRKGKGLDPADPILALTQIERRPYTAKALEVGPPEPGGTGSTSRGNLKNPKQNKLVADTQAGLDADNYETNFGEMLEHTMRTRAKTAAKAEMYRTMEEAGILQWGRPGQKIEGSKELPGVKPPVGTQKAQPGETSAYVKESAYQEVRQALAVDQPNTFSTISAVNNILNRTALASTLEAVYHARNLLTFWTKPGVNPLDIFKNYSRVVKNTPEIADRLMELARIGAGREGEAQGMLWGGKTDPTLYISKFLHILDSSMRLTAEDAFKRLEKAGRVQGGEQNMRDFINQLGQYAKGGQHKAVVLLRDTGFGPFATAGTNYYMQGLRSLTLNPGVKATSPEAAVLLRAETLGKLVGVLTLAGLTNYLLHKRIDGDEATPFGAIKVGEREGKTIYMDPTSLITGLPRGLRETGLLALAQGVRKGDRPGKILDKASEDMIHSLLHPAIGPPVQFAWTAATGKSTMGTQLAGKGTGSDAWANLKAALANANPAVAALTGASHPGRESTLPGRVNELAGPFGEKESTPAVGDYFGRLHDLEERRKASPERRLGKVFPEEAEYRRLHAYSQKMAELSALLKGERKVNGQTIQGEKPDSERAERLRKIQIDLARKALAKP